MFTEIWNASEHYCHLISGGSGDGAEGGEQAVSNDKDQALSDPILQEIGGSLPPAGGEGCSSVAVAAPGGKGISSDSPPGRCSCNNKILRSGLSSQKINYQRDGQHRLQLGGGGDNHKLSSGPGGG